MYQYYYTEVSVYQQCDQDVSVNQQFGPKGLHTLGQYQSIRSTYVGVMRLAWEGPCMAL